MQLIDEIIWNEIYYTTVYTNQHISIYQIYYTAVCTMYKSVYIYISGFITPQYEPISINQYISHIIPQYVPISIYQYVRYITLQYVPISIYLYIKIYYTAVWTNQHKLIYQTYYTAVCTNYYISIYQIHYTAACANQYLWIYQIYCTTVCTNQHISINQIYSLHYVPISIYQYIRYIAPQYEENHVNFKFIPMQTLPPSNYDIILLEVTWFQMEKGSRLF